MSLRKFLKEIGLEEVSGLTSLHTIFHGLTIRLKYDDLNVVVLHKGVWRITAASDLTESSTAMINKRNIIVNVKVNITVQRFEKENKVLDFSVVTKR